MDDDWREMLILRMGAEGESTERPVKWNSQAKGPHSDMTLESICTEGAILFS